MKKTYTVSDLVSPISESAAYRKNVKIMNHNFDSIVNVVNRHSKGLNSLSFCMLLLDGLVLWNALDIFGCQRRIRELEGKVEELENKKDEEDEMEN